MTALIVCNGSIRDYTYYKEYFDKAELIIGADGGAKHLLEFGVMPHILMGDFDSIASKDLEKFKQLGIEIMKFPVEKDMTDAELAVEYAISKGYKNIILLGVLGTRVDHSLSNIMLLKKMLDVGITGQIVDEYNIITLIHDKISLNRKPGFNLSILPISPRVEGVTTKGLYYPLNNATIEMGSSWGVSNEFAEETAEVTIRDGLLLVIQARD
ncbi:MAG: thiN [Clostridiales bacterium]|jgi:thiamine pyrophosphokinase|nr:thiN [Clostridiales bacterium]